MKSPAAFAAAMLLAADVDTLFGNFGIVSRVEALTTIDRNEPLGRTWGYAQRSTRNGSVQTRDSYVSRIPSLHPKRTHYKSQDVTTMGSAMLDEINTFYQSFPIESAFITCGIKASAADAVAQNAEASQEDEATLASIPNSNDSTEIEGVQIEAKRNLSFIMYGGLYQGIAQHIIFNEIFPLIFGDGTDLTTVASKVLFDSLVISPFICLPVAYLVKSVVYQFSLEEAFSRYRKDVTENGLLFKYWSVWVPAQCLTFGVIPPHLRIVWIAFVSFFWLVVFSSISSQSNAEPNVAEAK